MMDKKVVSVLITFFVLIGVCLCGCTEKPAEETSAVVAPEATAAAVSDDNGERTRLFSLLHISQKAVLTL